MSLRNKTLINILGAGRSGTTMLDLMLGNDRESFSLGEVHAWFRPFRKHHFVIDCNCGNVNCEYWNKIKHFKEYEFHTKVFNALNINYLIDSSKNLVWIMDVDKWLKGKDIEVVNLLIYKPVISYIYSIWKRGESVEAALYRYKLYYKRFFQSGLSAYIVSFDELVVDPDETLYFICGVTGQTYDLDRKVFWKKEHHHLFGSGGIRKQARGGSSKIIKEEEFSLEFQKLIPEYEKIIAKDKELSNVIDNLKRYDIKKVISYKAKNRILKPLWYYYLKYLNQFHSIFPIQSKHKQ